jgi:hypothetical protein
MIDEQIARHRGQIGTRFAQHQRAAPPGQPALSQSGILRKIRGMISLPSLRLSQPKSQG